jgi:hypothetical protein
MKHPPFRRHQRWRLTLLSSWFALCALPLACGAQSADDFDPQSSEAPLALERSSEPVGDRPNIEGIERPSDDGALCREQVGRLPLELTWLQAPKPGSATPLNELVTLQLSNPGDTPVVVDLLVRSNAQPRPTELRMRRTRLGGRESRTIQLRLDELVKNIRELTVSGRLDALARVKTRGSRRWVNVASAPAYFHQDTSTGVAMLYGQDVLRQRYRAGDLAGVVDERVVDIATALEVIDMSVAQRAPRRRAIRNGGVSR